MQKKYLSFFLFIILTGFSDRLSSDAEEYNLKAAFIYNFTKYIEWDASVPANEFVIGVIGPSPIAQSLSEIANTKTINEKKIIIRQYKTPEELNFCHILFISRNVPYPLAEILAKATVKGTLIVSEKTGLAEQGAAINFIVVNKNLKFEANTKAINSAGLKVSSQLLKLAILVEQ